MDDGPQVIVATTLSASPTATAALPALVDQIETNTGCPPRKVLADAGYASGARPTPWPPSVPCRIRPLQLLAWCMAFVSIVLLAVLVAIGRATQLIARLRSRPPPLDAKQRGAGNESGVESAPHN